MKVQILKESPGLKGRLGQVVECDPAIGNPLACRGLVRVVEHDAAPPAPKPPQPRDVRPKKIKRAEAAAAAVSGDPAAIAEAADKPKGKRNKTNPTP